MQIYRTKLVTFSGIDGAGKSTQIKALESHLRESGLRFAAPTFWDDVVVLSRFREHVSEKAFQGDKGIGSPEKPINRRDKNVTSWYVVAARLFLYLLDALSLRSFVKRVASTEVDYIVFDRYIYDELANLPLHNGLMRAYVRFVLRWVPRPDVAYLIDADPETARIRKPEYPLEFLHKNRDAYLALSRLIEPMRVIKPGSVEQMFIQIQQWISLPTPSRSCSAANSEASKEGKNEEGKSEEMGPQPLQPCLATSSIKLLHG